MKTLTRIGFALCGAMAAGVLLFWLIGPSGATLAASDLQSPPLAAKQEQILLRVIILDYDRDKLKALGIDFHALEEAPTRHPADQGDVSIVSHSAAQSFIKALAKHDAAKILAEPTIVASDGRTAKFRSGGAIPLVVPEGQDKTSGEYREFGTSIDFTPRKLSGDRLRLELRVVQSDLDHAKGTKVQGVNVPALTSRKIDTAIVLAAGKTAILGSEKLLVIVTPELVAAPTTTADQPAPRVAPPSEPAAIVLSALIYSLDSNKLRDADIDVPKTLEDASQAQTSGREEEGTTLVSVIGPRTVSALQNRFLESQGAEVLSRPKVRTLSGKPARIQVGSRVPIPRSSDVQAGSARFHDVGVNVKLVPIMRGDHMHLEATVVHSQLKGLRLESIHLHGVAELYPGETLAICQNDQKNEQLLVLITHEATNDMRSKNETRSETAVNVLPAGTPSGNLPSVRQPNLKSAQQRRSDAENLAAPQQFLGPRHPDIVQQGQRIQSLDPRSQPAATIKAATIKAATIKAANPQPLAEFTNTLQAVFPESRISVHALPDAVLLSGTVPDRQQVDVVARIAETFFPRVILHLTVAQPSTDRPQKRQVKPDELPTVLRELFPDSDIRVRPLNNSVVLSGNVDAARMAQVIRVAEDYYPNVINDLTKIGPPQNRANDPYRPLEIAKPARRDPESLHEELRELRQDVKRLRSDVGRLIELLQDAKATAVPAEAGSGNVSPATDETVWNLIGIRVEPTGEAVDGYRGGLRITEIRKGSPAAKQGMSPGDVLLGLDKWETIDRSNLAFVLAQIEQNPVERLEFYLLRGDATLFGHLRFDSQPGSTPANPDADKPTSFWELTLDEVITMALGNSKVLRNDGLVPVGDRTLVGINADVDIGSLEVSVSDLLSDVEESYWNLWAAHRGVETISKARDDVMNLWRELQGLQINDAAKSNAEVNQRFWDLRAERETALKTLRDRERRLRFLIGLARSDGRLIHPTDQPSSSSRNVEIEEVLKNGLANAPQLRQLRQSVRVLELDLQAAKRLLPASITSKLDDAAQSLSEKTSLPVGQRRALAQVRALELQLDLKKSRIQELELSVSQAVSEAILARARVFQLREVHSAGMRQEAKHKFVVTEDGGSNIDELMAAIQGQLQSTLATDEASRQLAIAAKNVRLIQGALLRDRGVRLVEVAAKTTQKSPGSVRDVAESQIPNPTLALKPNDRLTIESLTDKSLNRTVTILADGSITLPLLGQVPAAGLSLERQREELEARYRKYFREPNLTLSFYGTSVPLDALTMDAVRSSSTAPDPKANLKPGDRLMLELASDPSLGRQFMVLADGSVTLPWLGQVPAAGRTLATLNAQLTARYAKYFREPDCTLSFLGTSISTR